VFRSSPRGIALFSLCALFFAGQLQAQEHEPDTTAYASVVMDSSEIRRLPLARSSEVTSFLPGSILGLGYNAGFSGAIGNPDVRVDGVPALNLTHGTPLLVVPASALTSVSASLAGSSARYGNLVSVDYTTHRGGTDWSGYATASSDAGMPGSIGNVRMAGGAGGPLGRLFRASLDLSVQAAEATEFNNLGDVKLFAVEGIDTTITIPFGSGTRTVPVPSFVEIDSDRLPASGWNEQLATARLDFLPSPRTNAFVAGYFTRLQEREPFGGGCSPCALYNPLAQRGARNESTMLTFGVDHAIGRNSLAQVRLSHAVNETTSGVLRDGSTGLFDQFAFLTDDDSYPVNDELIRILLTNAACAPNLPIRCITPFNPNAIHLMQAAEFGINPYGTRTTYATRGAINGEYGFDTESRLFGSASFRTHFRSHAVTAGVERSSISARLANMGYINPGSAELWKEKPTVLSAFAEDVFHLGNMTVQAGVRYDSFDPNSRFPVTPGYIIYNDDSTTFDAPTTSAFSPRVAVASHVGKFVFHGGFGRAAIIPQLALQYEGKNLDIFRYGFTNTNDIFGSPVDLYTVTSGNAGGVFHASSELDVEFNAFLNRLNDAPVTRKLSFDDPTNPGSAKYLTVWTNGLDEDLSGIDANLKYRFGTRSVARIGASHERIKSATSAGWDGAHKTSSVVGLVQVGSDRIPGNLDVTLALRGYSPGERSVLISFTDVASDSWITRFDARITKEINVAGIRGSVFADGLRLLGSSAYLELPDNADLFAHQIEDERVRIGAGNLIDNIDLRSLANVPGVLNEVDLYMLQQAEARFGNGDKMFSAAEQSAVFGAAARLRFHAGMPATPSRRIVLGAQLAF
jgi:hypothetical protein